MSDTTENREIAEWPETTWDKVLSPNVKKFVDDYGGQGVSPAMFAKSMKDAGYLTGDEKFELVMFQLVHKSNA